MEEEEVEEEIEDNSTSGMDIPFHEYFKTVTYLQPEEEERESEEMGKLFFKI